MKRILGIILTICMLLSILPTNVLAATAVTIFNVTVTEPKVGEKPQKASLPETASTLVTKTEWEGELDENGRFKNNTAYTVYVTVRIKVGQDKYIKYNPEKVKVNGNIAEMSGITSDKKYATISYTFYLGIDESTKQEIIAEKESSKPIEEIGTWTLTVKDGKPHYNFIGSSAENKENYYLADIKYENPDGAKPYTYTTAVATFKAKDGYYFIKALKLKEDQPGAENTVGFKRIDEKTVEVYLTAFTGNMGQNDDVTDAMIAYKEKISKANLLPVASAEFNFPLYDYWENKYKTRDFESEKYVNSFVEKNIRATYSYPTTKNRFYVDKQLIDNIDTYPSNITIKNLAIADLDLSDDIPGLVGEWCLLTNGRFIPKGCIKNITSETKYTGAPGKFVDSPYVFAGGSGTKADPYLIETADQLNAVRKGPNNHYKLISDIDLSNWGNWIPIGATPAYGFMGGGWNAAEEGAYTFFGSFDGNGHVVSGMQIIINEETPFMTASSNWLAYGLFGTIANTNDIDYTIKNLGVVNFNIDVNYTSMKTDLNLYAAAICGGMSNSANMTNCYSEGGRININVTFNKEFCDENPNFMPRALIRLGGICSDGNGSHIEKSFNDSDLSVNVHNGEFTLYAGGIIATMELTHIHECYNSGTISLPVGLGDFDGSWHDSQAAGICAYASIPEIPGIYHFTPEGTSFIQNCYNSGQIAGRGASGIFLYSGSDIHLENCYNVGAIIGNELDHSNGASTINQIISKASAVVPYGTEFIRNCYDNGNSVSGSAWKYSSTLGRKVLAAIPEDSQPAGTYDFVAGNVGTFTDVKTDAWYADAVKWAVDKNITSGTSATTFSPDNSCTRAQILTFLWRAVGSPKMSGANPFSDVKTSDYFYDAALWASSNGMVTGTTFAPDTPCTRAETVVFLWKNAGCPESPQANQFLDIENHQSELGKAVSWAYVNAITGGTAMHTFSPDTTCTRGQIVTFLQRAIK